MATQQRAEAVRFHLEAVRRALIAAEPPVQETARWGFAFAQWLMATQAFETVEEAITGEKRENWRRPGEQLR